MLCVVDYMLGDVYLECRWTFMLKKTTSCIYMYFKYVYVPSIDKFLYSVFSSTKLEHYRQVFEC